jgi:hypothetical protein
MVRLEALVRPMTAAWSQRRDHDEPPSNPSGPPAIVTNCGYRKELVGP